MRTFELKGTLRNEYGKKAAKAIRQQNLIPCNLYGNGENVTFTVSTSDVRKLVYTPDTLIVDLTVGEKNCKAIVKELQFHPVNEQILHIDFLEVTEDKPATVEIPIQLTGHAEGVKAGGKLSLEMRKLKVRGLYMNFPDRMLVDVTELGLGKKLSVGQLHFDNLELVNVANQVVVQVKATRASAQAAPSGKK